MKWFLSVALIFSGFVFASDCEAKQVRKIKVKKNNGPVCICVSRSKGC